MTPGSIRYCGPFLFAASIPAFYYTLGSAAPLLTVAALLVALVGAELISLRGDPAEPQGAPFWFQLLPFFYIPLQLCVIGWAAVQAGRTGLAGFVALALAVGVTTGVFGVLAAHEMVHGHDRTGRLFGLAMLSGMTYRHFRIAHVHGHHRWAATELDPATARLGESFYGFLIRTLAGQYRDAWRFEHRRTAVRYRPFVANRMIGDAAAMLAIYALVLIIAGPRGALFLAVQSIVGIVVLELFNYIAHYGLVRGLTAGRRESFGAQHSWNSSNVAANALIFNMGRHSHHHSRPAAPYQNLELARDAPELPLGYAGSILLALIPPLWRRVMDPEVQRLQTGPSNAPA
jgi:alkane 1-monooxygenase